MSFGVAMTCVLCLLCAGCEREPLDFACPPMAEGDLAVSEIRGPQSGDDIYGEWIELYNAGNQSIDLLGTLVQIQKLDGSSEANLLIRDPISAGPGEFIVLGRQRDSTLSHVDYGYAADFDAQLFDTGAVTIFGCDRNNEVDRAIYRNLPSQGTLGVDGTVPPSSSLNDDDTAWCIDDEEDANSETDGIRGTPKEQNRTCL